MSKFIRLPGFFCIPGFLLLIAGCSGSGPGGAGEDTAGKSAREETTSERLARIIREYDAQGMHRTGTEADQASGRWLADEVRHAGFEPALEPLTINRVDPIASYVEIGERRIEGIPLIDSAEFTGAAGIEGRLGPFGSSAAIGYGRLPPAAEYFPEFTQLRTKSPHSGLLVVTGGDTYDLPESQRNRRYDLPPGYALINADRFSDPFGKPVLQLPSQAYEALVEADRAHTPVRLVNHISRTETEVFNVAVTVAGSNPGLAPIVIMTPRSGWWQCASERAGGIAMWVELLHALRAHPPARTVHFLASTGHELGHLGLDSYLERHHELIKGAHVWIHIGANFATAVRCELMLQASSRVLWDLALGAMQVENVNPDFEIPIGERPLGEARNIYDGGGSYISILAQNGLFHSPDDRWPEAVDLARLEKLTRAFKSVLLNLIN